jgi:pyruvate kinase
MPDRLFRVGDRTRVVDADAVPEENRSAIPLTGFLRIRASIGPGHRLVFRDGRQEFRILTVRGDSLEIECLACTEPLQTANACSFPDSGLQFDALRPEDTAWLRQFAKHGLRPDWVAVSLVTEPSDIERAQAALTEYWPTPPVRIMAKIETEGALKRLNDLVVKADGVLLGRGDLGLSVPVERIPRIQEKVANEARSRVKLFTVATQVLERFAATGVPYRAELSDIALAVRQGAAAVVLCQETNDSPRPVACIELMRRVIALESDVA